ncbi:GAF and ANTAR domain-containing protein [Nocardioides zeae]|uniref:GAF domain-containing protein n=1 Tax=Nocardioides zeae TaxID=1457234 RepID=A0AAJ1X551_9ACTN|nr:GAF and ANTAR domain-containing protein [Nocardioides zeae]MDQ1106297.1 GAF domain-containing protein [Nocardioides zeae]
MNDLSRRMAELARDLDGTRGTADTADQAVRAAVETIPSCTGAGLTMLHRDGTLETVAATDDAVLKGDRLQYELGEGPCVQAIRDDAVVHSADLAADDRWPRWVEQVVPDLGARSMLAVRLWTRRDDIGALNLYSTEVGGFDHDERETALTLAAHTAVAIAASSDVDDLHAAMERRTRIGAAIGIVMERHGLTQPVAFEVLRRLSQEQNRKLHELAGEVVGGGRLTGD